MNDRVVNTWIPISEFPFTPDDSLSFQGKPDTWSPNKILLFGHTERESPEEAKIWSLDSLYYEYIENEEDRSKIMFSSETWSAGNWELVIPIMYMEVTPPDLENQNEK